MGGLVVVAMLIVGMLLNVLLIGSLVAFVLTRPPEHWVWSGRKLWPP